MGGGGRLSRDYCRCLGFAAQEASVAGTQGRAQIQEPVWFMVRPGYCRAYEAWGLCLPQQVLGWSQKSCTNIKHVAFEKFHRASDNWTCAGRCGAVGTHRHPWKLEHETDLRRSKPQTGSVLKPLSLLNPEIPFTAVLGALPGSFRASSGSKASLLQVGLQLCDLTVYTRDLSFLLHL